MVVLGLVAVRKLSLVEGRGGYALVAVHGLLTVVASRVPEHATFCLFFGIFFITSAIPQRKESVL